MDITHLVEAANKMAPSTFEADLNRRARKIMELVETAAARDHKYFNIDNTKTVAQNLTYDNNGTKLLARALQDDAAAEAAGVPQVTLDIIKDIIGGDTEIEASSPALLSDKVRSIAAFALIVFAGLLGLVVAAGIATNVNGLLVVAVIVCVVASTLAFMGWGTLKIRRGGDEAGGS